MNDFAKRRLDVTFTLGPVEGRTQRTFSRNGKPVVKLSGLRCRASVVKQGEGVQSSLNLSVWGVPFDVMNELSTLRVLPGELNNNTVLLEAGSDEGGMSVVYRGSIIHGWANMNAQPDVSFEVVCLTGQYDDIAPANALGTADSVAVADIVKGLCDRMGRAFTNHGVDTRLSHRYYSGSLLDQLRTVCRDARVTFIDEGDAVHIFPDGAYRKGAPTLISPATGMVGYPSYTSGGIDVTTLFNPNVLHGSLIKLESSLQPACGEWAVLSLVHELESEAPGGAWFTLIRAANPIQTPIRTVAPR